ncbi:MAG: hypothetical protein JKX83_05310 [Pseudomonadales bacterium]|nr:hypothetical protein [Pseudomonadales bacterium]PCJ36642.1 MAG: hypothetical protein COA75_07645 [Cellvibrionales bacterium]
MAFILGAVLGMYLISSLVGFVAFRKMEKPKKHYLSVPIAWVLSTILAGYGMADGGDPQFVAAAINYGIASVTLLAIYAVTHLVRKTPSIKFELRQ